MAYQSRYTGPQIDDVINICRNIDNTGISNLEYLNKLKTYIPKIQEHEERLRTFDNGSYLPSSLSNKINNLLPLSGGTMLGTISKNTDVNGNMSLVSSKSLLKINLGNTYRPLCAFETSYNNRFLSIGINSNNDFVWHYDGIADPLVRITTKGQVFGSSWNDLAEYRNSLEYEPGRVVYEIGNGILEKSVSRLQPGAMIISDTFGFAIGQTKKCSIPVAIAGRVLAYPFESIEEFEIGDAVCSGPNGTISKMSRQEIQNYPDRIIGIVSEIPNYEFWGPNKIPVNKRIWIYIK